MRSVPVDVLALAAAPRSTGIGRDAGAGTARAHSDGHAYAATGAAALALHFDHVTGRKKRDVSVRLEADVAVCRYVTALNRDIRRVASARGTDTDVAAGPDR